jgi:hypothetical protein
MTRLVFLPPTDEAEPRPYGWLLAAVGFLGLLQAFSIFPFAYYSWDFGPFCFAIAAPLGMPSLFLNLFAYLGIRRLSNRRALSKTWERYLSREMVVANGIAILFGFIALITGYLIGAENNPWLGDISVLGFLGGSMAVALIFFSFNALGLLGGLVLIAMHRKRDR